MAQYSLQPLIFALSLLLSIVSCAPIRPFMGNQAYALEFETDETQNRWVFNVYADGYNKVDADGQPEAVDTLIVNKQSKRLTVVKAMNGLDTTEPRLKMRQVLKECWTRTGLAPSDLKEVLGYNVENTNMQEAIGQCRDEMGLKATDSFVVSGTESVAAKKACWHKLGTTVFSWSIMGAIKDFDIKKKLISIDVENGGPVDHVYYKFS
ncbi:hypothetical protein KVR01_012816 [Diaporthe batatas]|uniref:uncharacterized protein n=1 Tax=Diaporthe batatas TaxID=748121 RepID=UPI001D054920|nr:uncharacterized protein KVR01_012816 [Diaporthe batatas]KAG8157432.1 hypothetical protein KVR01_012816 [Diaporthe batatas]